MLPCMGIKVDLLIVINRPQGKETQNLIWPGDQQPQIHQHYVNAIGIDSADGLSFV